MHVNAKLASVRRRLVLFLSLLALSACQKAGERADLLDTRTPPQVGPRFYPPEGWAWGEVDKVRYGVTAPAAAPRGQIVILAGSDEPAEVYFETVRDLTARGWTVWVMDAAADPVIGAAGLRGLIDNVIRPKADEPLVIAGGRSAAVTALIAVEENPRRIEGLFLWEPPLADPLAEEARDRVKSGLGGLPATGEHDWARPDYDLSGRGTLVEAWRTANPDLRPKKRPWKWFADADAARQLALRPERLAGVRAPAFVIAGSEAAWKVCAALVDCGFTRMESEPTPYHLGSDGTREVWLNAFLGLLDEVHTL